MNEDNIQGMIGQAQLAGGTPSVESVTSTPGMGFGAEQALSVFGQPKSANVSPLESQYREVLGMARKAATDRKNMFSAGLGKEHGPAAPATTSTPQPSVQNGGFVGVQTSQQPVVNMNPSPAPVVPEPMPQIVSRRSMTGADSRPSYDYNGVSVMLPEGVDVNDAEAVRTAMKTENEYIDMLNDDNEEDF